MNRYLTVKINGKTKLLHRHLMEIQIGRELFPEEHVHHKDKNTKNNALDNLEVRVGIQHVRQHAEERRIYPRSKPCLVCSTIFTPHPSKRKIRLTCSKSCADELRSRSERATKAKPPQVMAAIVRANVPELIVRYGDESKAMVTA